MENEEEIKEQQDTTCPRCGIRSYDDECRACGTPIILDKKEKEEENDNYNWREHKR